MVDLRTDRLGQVTEVGDRIRLDYERIIDAPIARVWRALVAPDEAARWWRADSVTIEEGVKYLLHGAEMPEGGPITAWDPPHLLAFEWNRDETNTPQIVTFQLEDLGAQTRLLFSHEGLLPHWAESVLPGWHSVLVQFEAQLAGEDVDGDAVFQAVAPHYGATQSLEAYRDKGKDFRPPD